MSESLEPQLSTDRPGTAAATAAPSGAPRWRRRLTRIAAYAGVVALLVLAYRFQVLPARADALLDYFLYMCCATTITPLPTVPVILLAATKAPALLVAVIGAGGTTVAYLLEYAILGPALRLGKIDKVKESRGYRWLVDLFRRAPFGALFLTALLPVPVDGARLLAIAERYHRGRYALAAFLGRMPRYFLIALPVELARRNAGGGFMVLCPRSLAEGGMVPVPVLYALLVATSSVVLLALIARWRRYRAVATLVLLLTLGLPSLAPADPAVPLREPSPPAELTEVIERFDRAVADLLDARGRFIQDKTSVIYEDTTRYEGELFYRAPAELHLRYDAPEQEIFIDSTGIWIYLVEQQQAQRHSFSGAYERDTSMAMLWRPSSELALAYQIDYADEAPSGETGGVWLSLSPRDEDVAKAIRALHLRISAATGLTDCLVMEEASGDRVRLELVELEINPGVDSSQLEFHAPPGVEVISDR